MKQGRKVSAFAAIVLLAAFILCACEPVPDKVSRQALVVYRQLKTENITFYKDFPARVEAALVSEVRPQVTGIITQRHFVEGGAVKAGDLLYSLDSTAYQAAYDKARAELDAARADLEAARKQAERSTVLNKSRAISSQAYESAQAALARIEARIKAGEAALKAVEVDLERASVRAPVSGKIGRSNVSAGMLVTENQPEPLARIQQFDPIYVDVALPEKEWSQWKRAVESTLIRSESPLEPEVIILPEYGPGSRDRSSEEEGIAAQSSFLDLNVRASSGAMTIRTTVPNANQRLLPGMWTMARVKQGALENVLLVPQRSVSHDRNGDAYVHVLEKLTGEDEFRIIKRKIIADRIVNEKWLVEAGLEPDDLLVLEGFHKVKDGQKVRGMPEDKAQAGKRGALSWVFPPFS